MVELAVANSSEALHNIFASKSPFRIFSGDTNKQMRVPPAEGAKNLKLGMAGILSHDVDDQVVTCRANTTFQELQIELAVRGQCLPYLPAQEKFPQSLEAVLGTIAGGVAMNLPHAHEALCGTWKDWLLGAKVILPEGLVGKSGSKAVKNVAGYDLHKFLVGSRGVFCVFLELTLRTLPIKALPDPDVQWFTGEWPSQAIIQRTLPADFQRMVSQAGSLLIATHHATSTLYRKFDPGNEILRSDEDWIVGWGRSEKNLEPRNGPNLNYFVRAKSLFDPLNQLNPGEFPEC